MQGFAPLFRALRRAVSETLLVASGIPCKHRSPRADYCNADCPCKYVPLNPRYGPSYNPCSQCANRHTSRKQGSHPSQTWAMGECKLVKAVNTYGVTGHEENAEELEE